MSSGSAVAWSGNCHLERQLSPGAAIVAPHGVIVPTWGASAQSLSDSVHCMIREGEKTVTASIDTQQYVLNNPVRYQRLEHTIMQAIQTKFLPCTNTHGSRIKAICASGSLTIPYPHDLSGQACHRAAAEALAARLGWQYGDLLGGCLPDGAHVFVFDNDWSRG